jgi:hypothetical protein
MAKPRKLAAIRIDGLTFVLVPFDGNTAHAKKLAKEIVRAVNKCRKLSALAAKSAG